MTRVENLDKLYKTIVYMADWEDCLVICECEDKDCGNWSCDCCNELVIESKQKLIREKGYDTYLLDIDDAHKLKHAYKDDEANKNDFVFCKDCYAKRSTSEYIELHKDDFKGGIHFTDENPFCYKSFNLSHFVRGPRS